MHKASKQDILKVYGMFDSLVTTEGRSRAHEGTSETDRQSSDENSKVLAVPDNGVEPDPPIPSAHAKNDQDKLDDEGSAACCKDEDSVSPSRLREIENRFGQKTQELQRALRAARASMEHDVMGLHRVRYSRVHGEEDEGSEEDDNILSPPLLNRNNAPESKKERADDKSSPFEGDEQIAGSRCPTVQANSPEEMDQNAVAEWWSNLFKFQPCAPSQQARLMRRMLTYADVC